MKGWLKKLRSGACPSSLYIVCSKHALHGCGLPAFPVKVLRGVTTVQTNLQCLETVCTRQRCQKTLLHAFEWLHQPDLCCVLAPGC